MTRVKKIAVLLCSLALLIGVCVAMANKLAQSSSSSGTPIDPLMEQVKQVQTNLGAGAKFVSGGTLNALNVAQHWNTLKAGLGQTTTATGVSAAAISVTPGSLPSRVGGFTQSETSTAWCGTNAVVAYNDSGSFFETLGTTGSSLIGFARSSNANGKNPTFSDLTFLQPGSGNFVASDPVVGCTSASNFYISVVGFNCTSINSGGQCVIGPGPASSNVTVSASSNGGVSFSDPVPAVQKDATMHLLDKDWMAVDPTTGQIYVTYTDIDTSGVVCGGGLFPVTRTAIELVSSTDGGLTWSSPSEITHVCSGVTFLGTVVAPPTSSVTGSQIGLAVDHTTVYVAYEGFGLGTDNLNMREIDIAKSTDNGATFGPFTKVHDVNCAGDCNDNVLQGSIRIFELPSLTMGKGSQAGKIFITWNDGDNPIVDPFPGVVAYNFADVLLVSSSDSVTWSAPVKVNNNPPSNTDHFQPAASSDRSGRVAVCFYDRRNDVTNNFLIDRYCANSTDGGVTFSTNTRITGKSFLSVVGQDALLFPTYMGDYDTLASDTLNLTSNFRGGFANNITGAPNVQENKF
jgi:hypothetical protein